MQEGKDYLTPEAMNWYREAADKLKVIVRHGAGYDIVDLKAP